MHRFFRLNIKNTTERNAWYLIVEMFWASIFASTTTFNAAYAIHLGADNTTVSLLTSLPAFLAVLVSIPAGQFLNTRKRRKPWLLQSLLLYRFGYLLIALSPLVHVLNISPGLLAVLTIVLCTIPAHFFNVGFIPLLTDIVPEDQRAGVFSARNMISGATVSVCGFLLGFWLERIIFPINYQIMFIVGFCASLISIFYLTKIEVPDSPIQQHTKSNAGFSIRRQLSFFSQALHKYRGFVRMNVNTLLYSIGLWAISPIYILYYVRILGASDAWIGTLGSVSSLSTIAGFALWRWVMSRWGEADTLKRTIVLGGIFPILVGLLPSLTLIMFAVAINGLLSPGISLSHLNTLMKVTPEDNRPGYTALYITISNIGVTILPFIGIAIANRFGFAPTLIVGGFLSAIGATSFWWWPVHSLEPRMDEYYIGQPEETVSEVEP